MSVCECVYARVGVCEWGIVYRSVMKSLSFLIFTTTRTPTNLISFLIYFYIFQNEIDARLKDDDGAFWMSFEDFLTHFFSINVCMVGQPLHSTDGRRKPWFESRERFDYSMIIEDGANEVCANSFLLTLNEDAETMYVSVHQEDIRHVNTTSYIDFGVVVLKVINLNHHQIVYIHIQTLDFT